MLLSITALPHTCNRMPTCIYKEKQTFLRMNRSLEDAGARNSVACVCFNRRSYVGVELVQWLCEQCLYVRCRTTSLRVWQVLLELGVLLSGKPHACTLTRLEVIQLNATVIVSCHLQWLHLCKEANIEVAQQIIYENNDSTAFFTLIME